MIVKLKSLKGEAFDLEVAPDMLVGAVKAAAAAHADGAKQGWEKEGIKLIYQGKVLDDAKDIASYGINEADFMVVMYSKPKNKPAAPAPAAPAPPAAASPAPAAEAPAQPAPADVPPEAAPAPAPAPAAAPRTGNFSAEAQMAIDNLVEMGYAKEQVEAAMVAAFMNPDRAVQYLEEGLPEPMDEAEGDEEEAGPTPTTWAELVQNRQFQREIASITDQTALQAYLGLIAEQDPGKLQLIRDNPQAFTQLLNASQQAAAAGVPPGGA